MQPTFYIPTSKFLEISQLSLRNYMPMWTDIKIQIKKIPKSVLSFLWVYQQQFHKKKVETQHIATRNTSADTTTHVNATILHLLA
jgi:hypothetical protein